MTFSRWANLFWLWLALGVAIGLYWKTINFDFVRTDDTTLIHDDWARMKQLSSIPLAFTERFIRLSPKGASYYRPITIITLIIDGQWTKLDAKGYHFTNLVLHLSCIASFYWLLSLLGVNALTRGGAVLVFALHPAATHAVGWIPGRTDLLLTLFSLLATVALLNWEKGSKRRFWMIWYYVLSLLAMLSKEAGLMLCPLGGLYIYFRQANKESKNSAIPSLKEFFTPWAIVLAVWFGLWSNIWNPAIGQEVKLSYFIQYSPIIFNNFGKLLIPTNMTTLLHFDDLLLWPGVIAIGLLFSIGLLKGNSRKLALTSLIWIILFSLPTLLAAKNHVLENRLYGLVPAIALIMLLVGENLWQSYHQKKVRAIIAIVGLGWLGYFFWSTFSYIPAFENRNTFILHAHNHGSTNGKARLDYANYLIEKQQYDKARQVLIKLSQRNVPQKDIHNNLGVIFMREKKYQQAEAHFRLELKSRPGYALSTLNLATILLRQSRLEEALKVLVAGMQANPNNRKIIAYLYQIYSHLGQNKKANEMRQRLQALAR